MIQQPLDMVEREVLVAIERRTPPPENSGAPFVLATPAVDIPVDFDGAHPVYIPPPKVKRDEGKNKFKSAGVAHPEVKRKEEESFRFKDRVQQILTKYCQVPSRELARMNVMEKFRRVTLRWRVISLVPQNKVSVVLIRCFTIFMAVKRGLTAMMMIAGDRFSGPCRRQSREIRQPLTIRIFKRQKPCR